MAAAEVLAVPLVTREVLATVMSALTSRKFLKLDPSEVVTAAPAASAWSGVVIATSVVPDAIAS